MGRCVSDKSITYPQLDALIQEKEQPDLSLSDEVERNWSEVVCAGYQFDRLKLEVQELLSVTQEEVCDWLHRFTHSGQGYRKLSVKVSYRLQASHCHKIR